MQRSLAIILAGAAAATACSSDESPDGGTADAASVADAATPLDGAAREDAAPADTGTAACTASVTASAPEVTLDPSFVFQLPAPTGPFAVATHRIQIADESRPEDQTDDPSDHRELVVQLFYPTDVTDGAPAPIMEDEVAAQLVMSGFPNGFHTKIRTNATYDAPLSNARARWPVILYSHGLNGLRFENQPLLEQLASEGAVVVAVSHPYNSSTVVFLDGRVVHTTVDPSPRTAEEYVTWLDSATAFMETEIRDLGFVFDTLAAYDTGAPCTFLRDRLDLEHAGAFGYSLGGAASVLWCQRDPRCKAAADLDGALLADHDRETASAVMMVLGERSAEDFDQVLDESTGAGYRVRLSGAAHPNFSMFGEVLEAFIPGLDLERYGWGRIGTGRAIDIYSSYVDAFIGEHVFGMPSSLLASSVSPYDEVFAERTLAGGADEPLSMVGTSLIDNPLRGASPAANATVAVAALGASTETSSFGEWKLVGVPSNGRLVLSFESPELGKQMTDVALQGRSVIMPRFPQPSKAKLDLITDTASVAPDATKGTLMIALARSWRGVVVGSQSGATVSIDSGATARYITSTGVDPNLTLTASVSIQVAFFDLAPGTETVRFAHPNLDCVPATPARAAPGTNSAEVTIRAGFTTILIGICE